MIQYTTDGPAFYGSPIVNSFTSDPSLNEIIVSIRDFMNLKKNWDHYNAEPVNKKSIVNAILLVVTLAAKNKINIDFAYPLKDGGLQLEYGENIEIEVYPQKIVLNVFDDDCNLISEDEFNIKSIKRIGEISGVIAIKIIENTTDDSSSFGLRTFMTHSTDSYSISV